MRTRFPAFSRAKGVLAALAFLAAPEAPWAGPASVRGEMRALVNPVSGQVELSEGTLPILAYNHRTIEPEAAVLATISDGNRIYARPRGDYIHPLYGLHGEVLTRDWSPDHPHHRGIYWAWPEVDFGTRRGDLHALQHVFARPAGEPRLDTGTDAVQVTADHLWLWENEIPIVREQVRIRAHRATAQGRVVDLEFGFLALTNDVTVARRDTRHYGGLNVRLATPARQTILAHTDPAGSVPRRAWSDLSGVFREPQPSGLSVFQHRANPEYPGDWIQYPDLAWCQPTFPSAGTRYPLSTRTPLTLRYRLWIHSGPAPAPEAAAALWDAYHAEGAAGVEAKVR